MGGIIDLCYQIVCILKINLSDFEMLVIVFLLFSILFVLIKMRLESEDQEVDQVYSKTHTMIPLSQYNNYVKENTLKEVEKLQRSPQYINYQKNKKSRPTSILSQDEQDEIIFSDQQDYTGRRR